MKFVWTRLSSKLLWHAMLTHKNRLHSKAARDFSQSSFFVFMRKDLRDSQVWWLMPVIPALLEAEVGRSPKIESSRPAWLTRRNLNSPKKQQKNQNQLAVVVHACNLSYSGGSGRRTAWTREAEVAVSRDHAIALQPGRQSETLSQKKNEWTWLYSRASPNKWAFPLVQEAQCTLG